MMSAIVAALVLLADQLTKTAAYAYLTDNSMRVVPDFLYLRFQPNTGAALGIFPGNNGVFIGVMLVILAAMVAAYLRYKPASKLLLAGGGLIAGGALGNLADRIFRGYVVDFLDLRFLGQPVFVFNIADCGVVFGAVLICVYVMFFDKKGKITNDAKVQS